MRGGLARYLSGGGNLISLSGNTAFYRVSFNEDMTVLESRKAVAGADDRWLPPDRWGERWHSDDGGPGGAFPFLGRPAWELFALDSQGMIDDGTPTEFAALHGSDAQAIRSSTRQMSSPFPPAERSGKPT